MVLCLIFFPKTEKNDEIHIWLKIGVMHDTPYSHYLMSIEGLVYKRVNPFRVFFYLALLRMNKR